LAPEFIGIHLRLTGNAG